MYLEISILTASNKMIPQDLPDFDKFREVLTEEFVISTQELFFW